MKVIQIKSEDEIKQKNLKDNNYFYGVNLNSNFNNILKKSDIEKYILLSDMNYIKCYDIDSNLILELDIDKITYIKLSMSSRDYTVGIPIIGIGVEYTFQIDLEVNCLGKSYHFEIFKPTYFLDFIKIINQKNLVCNDVCGVIELYHKYPNEYERNKYLTYHFKNIAKKYGLDNPRK